MNLEDQVSSLEPSKRLKELGVRQASLFKYHYKYRSEEEYTLRFGQSFTDDDISAFTVAELGEMLPKALQRGIFLCDLQIVRSSVWRFYYGNMGEAHTISFTAGNNDTEADARAKMLIYLIEQKLVTTS